jgi:hypothetical protein
VRKTLAAVTLVVAALFTTAGAAAAETGGQHFTIFASDGDNGTVIATGPVSGVGEAITIDDDNDLFVFPNGTFKAFHPQTGGSDTFNEAACFGRSTFSGTYTLSDGTGDYAGISGSGTYRGRAFFVADRTDTGCDENGGSSFFFVNASGTTTLP